MRNIFDYTLEELEEYFLSINEKKYKASQVFEWIYKKRIYNIDKMTNIGKELRERIKEDISFNMISIKKEEHDKLVSKYLFELEDNNYIESVLMEHDYGLSICISSQVGCNMGCKFCESGRCKKIRNLNAYEMVEQIILIEEKIKKRISSVVIMGIGEPFDNYENIMRFINIINHYKALEIGARHITISTCGLVPKIRDFSKEPYQVNLAISLHGSNDKIRDMIMPVNKIYNIRQLIDAIRHYIEVTNRRVTIEYVMLKNINDSEECAVELSKLLFGLNVYVNLINYNETNNIEFKKSDNNTLKNFYEILKEHKINVTIRKEFGSNIDAACGQLRSKEV